MVTEVLSYFGELLSLGCSVWRGTKVFYNSMVQPKGPGPVGGLSNLKEWPQDDLNNVYLIYYLILKLTNCYY